MKIAMGKRISWRLFLIFSILTVILASVFLISIFFPSNKEELPQGMEGSIPALGSAKEAFEKGYADGLVTMRPEVSTVAIKYEEPVMVKLFITYQRRKPAPEVIELRFDLNLSVIKIPFEQTYIRVNDYIRYKPEVVKIREDETAEAWVIIEFAKDFLDALNYNRGLGTDKIPVPIDVYISENYVLGQEYKFIAVELDTPLEVALV